MRRAQSVLPLHERRVSVYLSCTQFKEIPPMHGRGCLVVVCAIATLTISAQAYETFGSIERKDPRLDALLPKDAALEKLAAGFDWAEGPVWVKKEKMVLFSDVPQNTIYQWREGWTKAEPFLTPSGYTGSTPRGGEPGSNGLTLDHKGRLILAEHGDRRVARYDFEKKTKVSLARTQDGKRFNSPNDVAVKSNGDIYFTDPPYGLVKNWDDPAREQPHCGVYRISKDDGSVTLLTPKMTRPNGLAFSPDEKILYVAQSDPAAPVIMAFAVKGDGTLDEGKVFFDAAALAKTGVKGLPDGMKVDKKGNLWATGPGGVLILAPDGTHLGTIHTGEATANCAFGGDGSVLYITADMYLARIRTLVKGCGF
jgi:gluconolactonase